MISLLIFTLITAGNTYTQESSLDSLLKQNLRNEYFKVNMLMQTEGRYSIGDEKIYGGSQFGVANARISIRGNLDNGFFYRLYTDFSSEPNLLDAFIGYEFAEGLRITTGQMKPKQTLDYIPNPGATDFIDRTVITGKLVASREVGVVINGNLGEVSYYGGVFNGRNPLEVPKKDDLYYIGRLQYTFRDWLPGFIQVAVNGSHGGSASGNMGGSGPDIKGKRLTYGADFRLESNQWILAAEYLAGEYQLLNTSVDEKMNGYYTTLGYAVNEDVTVLTRWQNFSLDNQEFNAFDMSSDMLTLGLNIQTTEYISFQVNAEMIMPDSEDNQFGLSGVFQLQF
ncbi:MAG: porin [Bacteroidota bacterium]